MDRAVARRNVVLQTMVSSGAIDAATADAAKRTRVKLTNGLEIHEPHGLYFKEQVRRELVDRFGWQRVYQGGLRVYSTIDMAMQVSADAAVAAELKALDERRAAVARRKKQAAVAANDAGP